MPTACDVSGSNGAYCRSRAELGADVSSYPQAMSGNERSSKSRAPGRLSRVKDARMGSTLESALAGEAVSIWRTVRKHYHGATNGNAWL